MESSGPQVAIRGTAVFGNTALALFFSRLLLTIVVPAGYRAGSEQTAAELSRAAGCGY